MQKDCGKVTWARCDDKHRVKADRILDTCAFFNESLNETLKN